jgi:hypothetical protein
MANYCRAGIKSLRGTYTQLIPRQSNSQHSPIRSTTSTAAQLLRPISFLCGGNVNLRSSFKVQKPVEVLFSLKLVIFQIFEFYLVSQFL